jgi:hypothetical protein
MVLGNLTNETIKMREAFTGIILILPCGLAPKAFNNTTKSFEYTPACPADTAGGPVFIA